MEFGGASRASFISLKVNRTRSVNSILYFGILVFLFSISTLAVRIDFDMYMTLVFKSRLLQKNIKEKLDTTCFRINVIYEAKIGGDCNDLLTYYDKNVYNNREPKRATKIE